MKKTVLILFLLCLFGRTYADEGMWMLNNLNKQSRRTMKELGLRLSPNKLYNPKKAALSDAVVSFGGFCSGVVVSEDGLVFTNHHCGFSAVQQHSAVGQDYINDGFIAQSREEELPNPDLFVRFLLRTEEVTPRVLSAFKAEMNEQEREVAADSVMTVIQDEVYAKDSTLVPIVTPYYAGNEFWLSVYRDYNDVRLVFSPPSSVGKFGWDTDNWVWPRHTGDFSVFRIYADKENNPAEYSTDNVPYHPDYVASISLAGYKPGDFCMTIGYPGATERYLSSFGIEEIMDTRNQAMIDVRGVKQAIWKREMDKRDEVRIKYASKYDESSNYWKNSIGTNKTIRQQKLLEKKRAMETEVSRWIQQNDEERNKLLHLFSSLELNYKSRREIARIMSYFGESFFYGPELMQLALEILSLDYESGEQTLVKSMYKLLDMYEDMDIDLDREVFTAMIKDYRTRVDTSYLPDFYQVIDNEYGGDEQAFTDSLYSRSKITTPLGLKLFLEQDTTYVIYDDPVMQVAFDLLTKMFEMQHQMQESTPLIDRDERLLNAAIRRMYADRNFYPDANSTMRMSFGTIRGYEPYDGAEYDYFTTTKGIIEKARAHEGDVDFKVQPEILSLLSFGQCGKYGDKNGEMNVCFISDNDITGGNSGSAMFNAYGELLGLAFDGNWEAMGSDFLYMPDRQRCIGVDVRYMLFIMDKWGNAESLLNELDIKG